MDGIYSSIPTEFQQLSTLLEESPESLASGNPDIQNAALNATKYIFDLCKIILYRIHSFIDSLDTAVQSEALSRPHIGELLSSLTPSQAPQTRSKAKNAADKPKPANVQPELFEFTPLKSLFVEDMDEEQIWAQLDLRTKTICRMLDFVLEGGSEKQGEVGEEDDDEESSDAEEDDEEEKFRQALEGLENGDVDLEELMTKYGLNPEDFENSDNSMDGDEAAIEQETDESSSEEEEEDISPLRDSESNEDTPSSSRVPHSRSIISRGKKRGSKPSELDDGFFDLAEFNAETERAESKSSSRGRLAGDDDSDEEDMDIDLFAAVDGAGDFDDVEDDGEDAGMSKHF